jgi:cold shock CspA family protein
MARVICFNFVLWQHRCQQWSDSKGFGFITQMMYGEDLYFAHFSTNMNGSSKTPQRRSKVQFEVTRL